MATLTWCIFRKNWIVCSSAGPKILAFGSHSSANFQSILDCFISKAKLKYEDFENVRTDRVNTVVFNLRIIKRRAFFFGHPVDKMDCRLFRRKYLLGCLGKLGEASKQQ